MIEYSNNTNILVGSVKQNLDRRFVLGDGVSSETIVLFNVLYRSLKYCVAQFKAGNIEYSKKIKTINNTMFSLEYGCSDICNYKNFGTLLDFKASDASFYIDTIDFRISQLQIIL